MQGQFGLLQEELKEVEAEKERLVDELREMKKVAEEANLRLSEALLAQRRPQLCSDVEKSMVDELKWASIESTQKRDQAWYLELEAVKKQQAMNVDALSSALQELNKVHQEHKVALETKDAAVKMAEANARRVLELSTELDSVKESLANSREQLEITNTYVEELRIELEKTNYLAVELDEKEESLQKLRQELIDTKESESRAMDDLSETKMKLQMLEDEMKKAKESESKLFSLLTLQTNQLEQTKILLEESRLEITCLNDKVEYLERSAEHSTENGISHSCYVEKAKPDSQSIKEGLVHSQEEQALAQSKAEALDQELKLLRAELKLATDAEEKSRKAMDDMALALTEVLMEANEAKGKLISNQTEKENAMREVEHLKQIMKSREEKYAGLLSEARNEINRIKDEAESLRLEAEESNLAWSRKEVEFINCIKRNEEEFHDTQQDNGILLEAMREAEHMAKVAKDETNKLRDILKQGLNEANVAKEAAEIARAENYQLKDILAEKDITLQNLTEENERLRINEATALENIKDLKRLLSMSTTTGTAPQPPTTHLGAEYKEQGEALKRQITTFEENKDGKKLDQVLSVDIENRKVSNGYKEADEDPRINETLKTSSVFTDYSETLNSEDFDHLDGKQVYNMDHDRIKQRRQRALLKRFGDLLRSNLS
ncbi:hypothetical protein NE237_027859 [Protea cynaroides]|uniref:Uncharacterized protein n=1 Tax=Protea cynaroides TaxID=273540 RepID=A0A9Q0GS56_9MAGN|nr:hypothetical protein NE237_027859 [Protea cynaroides]